MDGAALVRHLRRSSHWAFTDNRTLYVWGGHQEVAGETVALPSDEIWLYDLDGGTWERREITGERPPDLSGPCGSYSNGTFYVFAGCDNRQYTNEMFSCVLTEQNYTWKRATDTKGTTPSPRINHSCWVHRDRLIYFGGYGPKTLSQNTSSASFTVEEMTWSSIGNALFLCWGWNNEVDVFDVNAATWTKPETLGQPPRPRSHHAGAVLGNRGYICGGVVSDAAQLDMFCLDLETWAWTQLDLPHCSAPPGRSMFTITPTSDHALFIYGGVGADGNTLNDAWQFHTQKRDWTKMAHPHRDKPRGCHTACLGRDNDVVVFGGSSNTCTPDSRAVLKNPGQHHCGDLFCFQTQPYSLHRLCEDLIGRNLKMFEKHLIQLPSQLRGGIETRAAFFSASPYVLTAPALTAH
ncbi:kelch domain-containing protein 1-like isoform X2 [Takifugu flavidus]|uniref:kelch domain-containing protein 1-like isoform X2 n=1 Tax=Takifugu flavidus TaxID=433684 RepID=UPI002544193D|nr:kelch domain-containing protein 1-like isoform X2 [Takifugu flavidus]